MSDFNQEACQEDRKTAEAKILDKLSEIEHRLYVDNGNLSIQTKLDRLAVAHLQNQWLARLAIGAVVAHIAATLIDRVMI